MNFEEIYRENEEIVYRYLFSLTRSADLAEKLTQETFSQALAHPGRYRGDAAPSTYLCGIAGNLMKKELRRRSRESPLPPEAPETIPGGNAEHEALENLRRQELFRRVHTLPEKAREVVYLRLSGDLTFAEIGEILGESETWARVTFYRAKQKLAEGGGV